MNRFEKVIEILDNAVGGPTAPVGFHGAFWRGLTRDQLVMKKVSGLRLIQVGNSTESNLVNAIRGELPFGQDFPGRPDADYNRMPSGMNPVLDSDIAFIEKWINEGCLEDEVVSVAPLIWRKTNAPVASSRTDDIWFFDPLLGWAVNSDGSIVKTTDGGDQWTAQLSEPNVYFRCIGFANTQSGWAGTLTRSRRLFHTNNGGTTWTIVSPLPLLAPNAICGLSVVNDQVVYGSGTNRPADFPRMIKTIDGGATWTAWDMSAHASILIDTYFRDALHGWVVGGKSVNPTPTNRATLKPVVLETEDGGITWINRLAGQEADFPFGEWGWKIQFISDQVGFVSLENFSDAAILKTIDGGKSWKRLKVNDSQANRNLEGIGFIDEQHGWVGGWGPGGFGGVGDPQGLSSATSDGGSNWVDANEIGLFINRFRFFGNPVTVGYASGDTVYKYSSDPLQPSRFSTSESRAARSILPDSRIESSGDSVGIRMDVPNGAKRLSLQVWDRFGDHTGCLLDEIHPASGERLFRWDTLDATGTPASIGEYIVRLTIDDASASSVLIRRIVPASATPMTSCVAGQKTAGQKTMVKPRTEMTQLSLVNQMQSYTTAQRDLNWLKDSLQVALELELATLPPYLTAYWSIKDATNPVRRSIREVWREEMLHFGLSCNMLVAIGGTPQIANHAAVPKYPGPLPGGIRPNFKEVSLRKLSAQQAKVFMDIEYPQAGPIALTTGTSFPTIGEFYEAVLATFKILNPTLKTDRQLSGPLGLFVIDTPFKVEQAIQLINVQGEGSNTSPEEKPGDLAHYYRFGEIYNGRRFVLDPTTGHWGYQGDPLPLPDVWEMADIPEGGYQQSDVPDAAAWNLIQVFDRQYSSMLKGLEAAWQNGDIGTLNDSISDMRDMGDTASEIIQVARPDGAGNYGPCFRYVP